MAISRFFFAIFGDKNFNFTPEQTGSSLSVKSSIFKVCVAVSKIMFYMCAITAHFKSKPATTPLARGCNFILEFLATYVLWPLLPAFSFTFLTAIILYCVVYVVAVMCCCVKGCRKQPSAAPAARPSGAEVAMV